MNFTTSLLYLLLLYAVLDKGNRLSLTTGLVIGFAILLFNCYASRCFAGNGNSTANTVSGNVFTSLNGF